MYPVVCFQILSANREHILNSLQQKYWTKMIFTFEWIFGHKMNKQIVFCQYVIAYIVLFEKLSEFWNRKYCTFSVVRWSSYSSMASLIGAKIFRFDIIKSK